MNVSKIGIAYDGYATGLFGDTVWDLYSRVHSVHFDIVQNAGIRLIRRI